MYISKEGNEMTLIEEMLPTGSNYTKSKSQGDNSNNNCNGDRVGGEKRKSDNLEGL